MSRINHTFSVDHAELYGIECAIMIHHFQFWIEQNKRLGKNFFEDKTWVYQTQKEIAAVYSYWGEDKVQRIIKKLIDDGVLIKGNFNKTQFDKTQWYAFSDEIRFSIPQNCGMDSAEQRNGFRRTTESYNDIDTKEDTKEDNSLVATNVAMSADADEILSFFVQKLEERKPDIKLPENPKKWLQEIDRMIRIDKRDPKKIRAMIDWIHRDSFWSTVILSPKKLRDLYDNIEEKAKFNFGKNNSQKNKEYALRLKQKYPETYKNFSISSTFVSYQGTGKELSLNLPHENFKRSFVNMFGGEYNDKD